MATFFVFLMPLLFFITASYIFNKKKLDESHSTLLLVSFLEGVFAYLITILMAYEGFFHTFWLFALVFLSTLIVGIVLFYFQKSLDQDWDLQLETIKNTFALFFMTFVPFMVSLTIFRFHSLLLQIIFALLLTLLIFTVGWIIKGFINNAYQSLFHKISVAGASFYIGVWIVFGIFLLAWIFFNFPKATLSKPLNLSDNIGYLTFDGFDTTMENNLKHHTAFKLHSGNLPFSQHEFIDYITDDDYLYMLREDGQMYVVSLSSGRMLYNRRVIDQNLMLRPKSAEAFFKTDDQIYLLTYNGLHHITPTRHTSIDDTIVTANTELIKREEGYLLLHKNADLDYKLLDIEGHDVHAVASFDTLEDTHSLVVISNHIFIDDSTHYQLWDDPNIRFEIKPGVPSFIASQNTMLYVESRLDSSSLVRGTLYTALKDDGQTISKNVYHIFNRHGVVLDDHVYLIPEFDQPLGRVEALGDFIDFEGIHQHHQTERIWFLNQFDTSYVVTYRGEEQQLQYLQVDHKDDVAILSLNSLTSEDVALPLPFYSHFGLGIFVPMIAAMFIPITNYRKYITIIDFRSALKQK